MGHLVSVTAGAFGGHGVKIMSRLLNVNDGIESVESLENRRTLVYSVRALRVVLQRQDRLPKCWLGETMAPATKHTDNARFLVLLMRKPVAGIMHLRTLGERF
jgi:hypothetical protein